MEEDEEKARKQQIEKADSPPVDNICLTIFGKLRD